MINTEVFYESLREEGINYFSGVPDSLLKDFCAYIKDNVDENRNIIAANEGAAVALATGYHLATGKCGLVYMQNSGLGNIVNPIASLVDKMVYSIPMLLVVGWRGEPGKKDEPQHVKQGIVTLSMLEGLDIKYDVLDENFNNESMKAVVKKACEHIKEFKEPYALVVKKNTFEEYKLKNKTINNFKMTREEAIEILIDNMSDKDIIVSTTGMASREVFEIREKNGQGHERDFLTVGSMGHASQIALGIAQNVIDKRVYCIDGDGATIMHMGSMAIIGNSKNIALKHVVINNGAHDSVGGQDTVGFGIDIPKVALACGYEVAKSCSDKETLIEILNEIKNIDRPALVEIKVKKGARKDLGRPTTTPIENKEAFMKFIV